MLWNVELVGGFNYLTLEECESNWIICQSKGSLELSTGSELHTETNQNTGDVTPVVLVSVASGIYFSLVLGCQILLIKLF